MLAFTDLIFVRINYSILTDPNSKNFFIFAILLLHHSMMLVTGPAIAKLIAVAFSLSRVVTLVARNLMHWWIAVEPARGISAVGGKLWHR